MLHALIIVALSFVFVADVVLFAIGCVGIAARADDTRR